MFKKYLSVILSLVLIICAMVSVFAVNAGAEFKILEVGGNSLIVGETLYENNFDNETEGALPSGWSAGFSAGEGTGKTSFGWSRNQTGYAHTLETMVVNNATYGKVLWLSTSNVDAFMALPEIGTLNYVYEANLIVNRSWGSLGLANNFYASTDKSSGAMCNVVYPGSASASIYKYYGGGTAGDWSVSYNPKLGDKLNLKIVSFNGYNYVYYNNTLVAQNKWRTVIDGTYDKDHPGFYSCNGNFYVTDVKVSALSANELCLNSMRTAVGKDKSVSVEAEFSYDKTQTIYNEYFSGDYTYNKGQDFVLGAVISIGNKDITATLTAETSGADLYEFDNALIVQNEKEINIKHSLKISKEDLGKVINVRPFVLVKGKYFYSKGMAYTAAALANGAYLSADSDQAKALIKEVFENYNDFTFSEGSKEITFTLFSDLHYNDYQYMSSIADMEAILKRADDSGSDFILSGGDFCNDIKGSPELINAFLNHKNQKGETLLAHNIYGNHELEAGNSMQNVTPTLTNNTSAVWGDGTVGSQPKDLTVAYYYFENNGFRIVCLDNNYSYNPNHINGVEVGWEHYLTGSYGEPTAAVNATRGFDEGSAAVGNIKIGSLAPTQMAWLETVLLDAADKDIPCIVIGHAGYSGLGFGGVADDAAQVREIYSKVNTKNPGTVKMSINGHIHTDNRGWRDGVLYLDTNTVRNNFWYGTSSAHYKDEHTFRFEEYDDNGNLIKITDKPLNSLTMGANTWFSADPLSCVVTVNDSGMIKIEGMESEWIYGVVPEKASAEKGQKCSISSGLIWECDKYGHIEETVTSGEYYHTECKVTDCGYVSAEYKVVSDSLLGDVNGDGKVDTTDLAELKLYLAQN